MADYDRPLLPNALLPRLQILHTQLPRVRQQGSETRPSHTFHRKHGQTLRQNLGFWLKDLYDKFQGPYFGVYFFDSPYLVLKSPELIKAVMVKDFSHFTDRTWAQTDHDVVQKNMMFFQKGEEWKVTRAKMTPVFTSGKLKAMFHILTNNGEKLVDYLRKHQEKIDIENLSGRYVLNGISRVFFGIDPHCLDDVEESEFLKVIMNGFKPTTKDAIRLFCFLFQHQFVKLFKLNIIDVKVLSYCMDAFRQVLKERENSAVRINDLADIILDLKKDKEFSQNFDFEGDKVLAQPFMFLLAGHNTTTAALYMALYELSQHKDVQNNLRDTVKAMLDDYGGIKYEGLMDKKYKYLDDVLTELERLYPALVYVDRTCISDYQLPGTDYTVRKGEKVIIPILPLHMDEKYFPNPDKFDPGRYANRRVNDDGLYYLPFGDGPRACIGERFALLNLKIALVSIISNFSVEPRPETPSKLNINPVGLNVSPKGNIFVDFKPL